jgi:hypothetical protein
MDGIRKAHDVVILFILSVPVAVRTLPNRA